MLFQVLCGLEPIFYTTHPNEEPNEIKNQAYQAFMSAISGENRNMLLQEQGNLNHLKLNLSISSSARTQINSIWDYYANQKH